MADDVGVLRVSEELVKVCSSIANTVRAGVLGEGVTATKEDPKPPSSTNPLDGAIANMRDAIGIAESTSAFVQTELINKLR
ncbi:hypothetical protein LCGC14_1851260 [marine sediment metagenome]|uniref:Uncharacterized protein n=1 Tax=marine sediment metagenome TaxID=412755 RepID=A0A0F9GYM2_9ZZZZ